MQISIISLITKWIPTHPFVIKKQAVYIFQNFKHHLQVHSDRDTPSKFATTRMNNHIITNVYNRLGHHSVGSQ